MKNALPGNPKTVQVNIRGSNTPEIHMIKIIGLKLAKSDEEGNSLARQIKSCGKTNATSNQEDGATSTGVRTGKKYEV